MAGVKGKSGGARANSGGARAGAGRKPKPKSEESANKQAKPPTVEVPERDMLTLLKDIALGRVDASAGQIRAAIAAVQYTHVKRADGGKKEEGQVAAKKAATGKFAPASAPRLVANGGRKV